MAEKPFSDIFYEQYLHEEQLMSSRCKKCGALYLPPRPICAECHDANMEWEEIKGQGKLAAFTLINIGPAFMQKEGYTRDRPYCLGVVELEEGPRVDARIEGVDTTKPETIKVGMPLRVKYLHRDEGENKITYLAYEPM
ncbi:MAG: Zn-ribbon domain-containing OB-fold protein [Desulfobacterales bacterium]|jgi:hypothetical protein|nr:hypothetical protein [Desulfobacter sp.]MDP6394085.1 Zn-ribbon domain-containing OB-fold protein [Desulfobacterales bacterium]MDP6684177.1 Zn-ribbon domain-containing OB-fold protein [Desulfobacterales bacterium]MDP6806946.1 Zn-ribbon domain-containing OB-fold protein [Desulfobacterales bacterium]